MPKGSGRRRQRIRWYRRPWIAFALAVLAAGLLLSSLVLRLLAGPSAADVVQELRSGAKFSGLIGFLLARMALTEKAHPIPVARVLILRLFPEADQPPPPVTPASQHWAPVAQCLGIAAFLLAGAWLTVELAMSLLGFIGALL